LDLTRKAILCAEEWHHVTDPPPLTTDTYPGVGERERVHIGFLVLAGLNDIMGMCMVGDIGNAYHYRYALTRDKVFSFAPSCFGDHEVCEVITIVIREFYGPAKTSGGEAAW
jgi:hypothetical protein